MRRSVLLLCLSAVPACGVELITREMHAPTPVRVVAVDPDPATRNDDGTPKSTKVGDARAVPTATKNLTAYTLPSPTRKGIVLDLIRSATATLEAGLYLVTDSAITQALIDAKSRGVAVRIVIDNSQSTWTCNSSGTNCNKAAMTAIAAAGIPITKAVGFSYHHAKYMVVDGKVALVMTCNFTAASFASNREVVIRLTDPAIIADLQTVFEADLASIRLDISPETALVISPINARDKLDGLVGNAQKKVIVAVQSVDDNELVARIIERKRAGLDVRVMMADPNRFGEYGDAQWLKDHGVEVRYLPDSLLYLHEKVISADDSVFVGSVNITLTSITKNREIGIIGDLALTAQVLPQVEADWADAVPF